MAEKEKYKCAKCGEGFWRKDFYRATGGIYAMVGYLPVCKTCFKEIYRALLATYKSEEKAVKRICMMFDLYYTEDIFNKCEGYGPEAVVGNYIRQLNMNQYVNKCFDDSVSKGFTLLTDEEVIELKYKVEQIKAARPKPKDDDDDDDYDAPYKVTKTDINTWGSGFEPSDYKILSTHSKMLRTSNPNMDSNQEIFISDLCYTKMLQMKAMREGRIDDYNKLTESYRKSFTQAGLKTVRESTANNDVLLGVTAEMIEKYTPAEYYKDKLLFTDFDSLKDYFERFVLRPIKNLQFGTKDRDKEFFVKEVGEDNEYIDEEE